MVMNISIDLCLPHLHLAGLAKPHKFLWYNTYLVAVQLSFACFKAEMDFYKPEKNGMVTAISMI